MQRTRAATIKEGSQIIDSILKTRKRRKRGGTNFSGSRQKRERELKRRKGLGVGGSESLRKLSRSGKVSKGNYGGCGVKFALSN